MSAALSISAVVSALSVAFASDAGFGISELAFRTPDGRSWSLRWVRPGFGCRRDGTWGWTGGNPSGGFRLFEADADGLSFEEHDAVDGLWTDFSDLADYLAAVGARRASVLA